MNKGDLIEKVAKECGLSKTASDQVLNSILNASRELFQWATRLP